MTWAPVYVSSSRSLPTFSQTFAAGFHQPWNQPPQPPTPPPPLPAAFDQPRIRCPSWKTPRATPPEGVGDRLACSPPEVMAPPPAATRAAFITHPAARGAAANYAAYHAAAPALGAASKAAPLTNLNMQRPPPPCPQPHGLGALSEEDLAKMLDMTSATGAMPHAALRPRIVQLLKEICARGCVPCGIVSWRSS